ncbi:MAG: efflux RND transporter permease subunit [Gammaproteobacteria bacterium]
MENTEDPEPPTSGLLAWFAANPVAANLLMAIIFLGGTLSLLRIDQEAYPRFAAPFVQVNADYPGAGPAEVEEGVCIPIEEAIHDLRGIKHINTAALDGSCRIRVEVEQDQDIQAFVSGVRARTQSLRNLPKAVERIDIDDYGWESAAITVVLRGHADKFTLRQLAERVRDELGALPGVRRANLWNQVAYEIAVEVPAARLRRHRLTLSEVAAAVRKSSLDLPGGELKASAGEFQLRAKYTAYDRARLLGLVLRTHPDGSVLRLGDIADVTDGFADQHFENTSDGSPSESIWVIPQHDLVEVAEEVKRYVETLSARLPEGIEVITRRDNARSFVELLDTLAVEGVTGFCLVLLVLMLFLRTEVAFWAAVGVLISIFGAFWWLPAAGVTLNMLSLFGFVLAMGVLVDDAIIVSERVQTLQAQGVSGLRGAIQGVREVAMPVTLGVGIGLVAFLPGLFVPPSWATQFMKPVAIVMILTLAFSLVESLLILPAHLAEEPPPSRAPSVLERVRGALNRALSAFIARLYRPFLLRALHWRYATIAAFAALLMIGVAPIQGEYLQVSLEEDGSYGEFHVHLRPPIGTPYPESEAMVRQFVDALAKVEAELNPTPTPEMPKVIEGVEVVLEERDPQVYVEFTSEARRLFRLQDVVKTWYKHIGDVGDFSPDFHTPTEKDLVDLEVELRAQDPAFLNAAADAVKARIAHYPGIGAIADSRKPGKPEIRFRLKPEGERLGLRLEDLAEQVRHAYEGEEAQRFMRGRAEVKIKVRHPRVERQSIDDLLVLPVRVPNGGQSPLGALAEIDFAPGYGGLSRADRMGVVELHVQLTDPPAMSPETISKDLEENLYPDLERRYPGIEISRGEAAEEADAIMESLKRNTLIALAVIYALLAVSFRSYVQPFLFLLAVPVAWLGGVLAHWALGLNLSFQSLVGMVAASGVVVNDSVVLLDYIRQRRTRYEAAGRRLEAGESVADRDPGPRASSLQPPASGLIIEACTSRFRAIFLVSLTNLAGFCPMLFETSEQAKFLVPVTVSLTAGLLLGMMATLVLVPACYAVAEDLRSRVVRPELGGALDRSISRDDAPPRNHR